MEYTFTGLLISVFVFISVPANGCTIEGINWPFAASEEIYDTHSGSIWDKSTSGIEAIQNVENVGLNKGPYIVISLTDSRLVISTNDAFKDYEEYETSTLMGVTITFRCTGGATRPFAFEISIIDTNNHDPLFRSSNYEFTIAPPLPPGFLVTNDIIVRDIDLTTQKIDFEITSGNSLFQITYEGSTVPKEFKAAVRTTTFIRSISEPITLTLNATDVDTTGDPRRSTIATVKITADTEFQFPDEPIFSQTFYLATYTTDNNKLILQDPIYLRQGFDQQVVFGVEGEHLQYFKLVSNENDITFQIKEPVSVELYKEGQIFLVVKAERTYTSGDTATVVVQLPEAVHLMFEASVYEGSIEDNKLNIGSLKLKQGYEDTTITMDITSDYKSYFSTSVDRNMITLSMTPLSDSILNENNFINLQVTATTGLNSTATTIVTLEIIKDDFTTPVFEKSLYTGYYDPETGLNLEQIILKQGYDNTVNVTLEGEHSTHFGMKQDGPYISLSLSLLSSELLSKQNILISVRATKPRTVGATTVVKITLPKATGLEFDARVYVGSIEDNNLNIGSLKLKQGYEDTTITVDITSDYKSYFSTSVDRNMITLSMTPLSDSIINENNFINLQVTATTGLNSTATTIVTLEIIKDDLTTPVFEKSLYTGNYNLETGLNLEQIILKQGYDKTVNVTLEGEHSTLFGMKQDGPYISLSLKSLSSEVIAGRNILVSVRATKPRTVGATAVVKISLPKDSDIGSSVSFDKILYNGLLKNGVISHDTIRLTGFTGSTINITGEHATSLQANVENDYVTVELVSSAVLPENLTFVALTLQADSADAVLILDVTDLASDIDTSASFDKVLYNGILKHGVITHETIRLKGFTGSTINIFGELATSFQAQVANGFVTVNVASLAVLSDKLTFIALILQADSAHAVLILDVTSSDSDIDTSVSFDKGLYNGVLKNGVMSHETIRLTGFAGSAINISGELATSFQTKVQNGYVTVEVLPLAVFPEQLSFIALTLQANSAHAILILDVTLTDSDTDTSVSFDKVLYNGILKNGVISHDTIRLTGFTGSTVNISGELATSFQAQVANGFVTVNVAPSAVLSDKLTFIALTLQAGNAHAVLILDVTSSDSDTETTVSFDKVLYNGVLKNGVISHETIRLTGFTGSTVNISGELATSFQTKVENGYVTVEVLPSSVFPEQLSFIALTLQASSAHAILILDVTLADSDIDTSVSFDKVLYNGILKNGVVSHETIRLTGFTGSTVNISGELATSFQAQVANGFVTVNVDSSAVLSDKLTFIALTLQAGTAHAVLILDVTSSDSDIETTVSFDKVLYNGVLKNGVISHETIRLTGFTGSTVNISGDLATSFKTKVENGYVTVEVLPSAVFPEQLSFIALTLQANSAHAVLLLDVTVSDSGLPIVTFSKQSYFFWADTNQTGSIGRVKATVDNGESVLYTITAGDDLQELISINAEGDILLLNSVDTGIYNLMITATAETSLVAATAPVFLRVDALPECSTENGLPPLIILERVEEEPHLNLVVLNRTDNENCWYKMKSLWPEDQSWLYVDNGGLHARAIDREDKSIAFMILSQIQVELILHCDSDNETAIVRRSITTVAGSELDTYEYGSNKWILADTITYNARRSIVNLIVQDINDNPPIFVGKENEPIYVGYPIPELENTILPRALIELKATDADIGENAALVYWSEEENLAIAATTGNVHIRNIASLENNSPFTVYATDQNGRGLNGSLDIVVQLLERNQIAVVTVPNAFLDDETSILNQLSNLVGYNVKVLRTVVISDSNNQTEEIRASRRKRDTTRASSASLQLFVYGISGSQLINVEQLTSDLDKVVSAEAIRVTSLNDHLEGLDVCPAPGQYTALLVSTITLAGILFLLIVTFTVWFLLKWRKNKNYEQFSDANSLASRIESEPVSKVETPKPRLDIEELKRSERRLQEMLDAPIPEITVDPPEPEINQVENNIFVEKAQETLIDITADPQKPIIIQSIDKLKDNIDDTGEDEFGEVTVTTPRKSVVTFNENVEKIIHLEYGIDENQSEPETEVYRL